MGEWNVSNVKDMSGMFAKATAFNQDISAWNVSKVKDMMGMFRGTSSFNQDVSRWKVSGSNWIVDGEYVFESRQSICCFPELF